MPGFLILVAFAFRFRKSTCRNVHLTLPRAAFRWLCCWNENDQGDLRMLSMARKRSFFGDETAFRRLREVDLDPSG